MGSNTFNTILKSHGISYDDFLIWLNRKYVVRKVWTGVAISSALTLFLGVFFTETYLNENPSKDLLGLLCVFVAVLWFSIVLPIFWEVTIVPWRSFIKNPEHICFDNAFLDYYSDPKRVNKYTLDEWNSIRETIQKLTQSRIPK